MSKIDYLDEQIVRLYSQDGRQSSEQIAKKLKVSAATVRRRTQKLIDNNLMRFVGVVNPADFGEPVSAILALSININKRESAMNILSEMPEISWMEGIAGHYNVIAGTRFKSMDALSDFMTESLKNIDGITDNEVFILLKMHKSPHIPLT
jgi:Lrp/AsnC family transcriptional regulator for asnA, asnC and gidA